jgi:SAM-dependent methyltransferase
MENAAELSLVNQITYARNDVVEFYQAASELLGAEKVLFKRLERELKGAKVLDLGVGGGRTTKYLIELTDDYTGVDYVAQFAAQTARKFPKARIVCGDARDLSETADKSCDFVLFSFNGIDSIAHADRLQVLSEVNRVLKPGGIFMFSSHNRDYEHFKKLPWQRRFHFSKGYAIFFLHCVYYLPKHFRMKKHEILKDEYAIVNDGDHRFSLMVYYIGIEAQTRQLENAAFDSIEAFDMNGERVTADTASHWIYYTARKR